MPGEQMPYSRNQILLTRYDDIFKAGAVGHRQVVSADTDDGCVQEIEGTFYYSHCDLASPAATFDRLMADKKAIGPPDRCGDGFHIKGNESSRIDHLDVDILSSELFCRCKALQKHGLHCHHCDMPARSSDDCAAKRNRVIFFRNRNLVEV